VTSTGADPLISHAEGVQRRLVLPALMIVTVLAWGVGACSRLPSRPGSTTHQPFTVSEAGGIDGRMNTLLVRPDGVSVLMSRRPAAGQLQPATLGRVRTLLASDDLREEAATADRKRVPVCPDSVSITLTSGDLTMTRTGSCHGVTPAPSPAFDEIVRLLTPALRGRFDGPVTGDQPHLVPVRVVGRPLGRQQESIFAVDAEGRVRRTTPGQPDDVRQLTADDRDVLRLLLERLQGGRIEPCAGSSRYHVTISGRTEVSAPDCGFADHQAEVRAVVGLIENRFG
jgi:hypothetical protein